MNIDYKNYKVYLYTQKELTKKFTQSTLSKYGKKLAFLYQNARHSTISPGRYPGGKGSSSAK